MKATVVAVCACLCGSAAGAAAQPGQPPAVSAAQLEQAALNAALEDVSEALWAEQSDAKVAQLRLFTEIELAGHRLELDKTVARLELTSKVATAVARATWQPTGGGAQDRSWLVQELSQTIQQYIQAAAQAGNQHAQAIGQATQRHAQQWSTASQVLAQDISQATQRLSQAFSAPELGNAAPALEATLPGFEPPALAAEEDPEAICRAEIDAAREAYLTAMSEAKATVVAQMEQALVDHAGDEAEVQKAMRDAMKRLRVAAYEALDALELSWQGALRKYALSVIQ